MTEFVTVSNPANATRPLQPQAIVLMDPVTGLALPHPLQVTLAGESISVSVPASVEINNDAGNAIPVQGPITDAQLRASAIGVSGPVTNAELRAAAVPVSGPLTDVQLRAALVKTDVLGIPGVARQITATTSSTNTVLTATCTRVSLKARAADMRFVVGTGAQTANASTSHFIEWGERLDLAVPPNAQIAVIRDTAAVTNGTLCITELV